MSFLLRCSISATGPRSIGASGVRVRSQVIKEAYCLCCVPEGYRRSGAYERPPKWESHDDAWSDSGMGSAKFHRIRARKAPGRSGHGRQADLSPYRRDGVVRERRQQPAPLPPASGDEQHQRGRLHRHQQPVLGAKVGPAPQPQVRRDHALVEMTLVEVAQNLLGVVDLRTHRVSKGDLWCCRKEQYVYLSEVLVHLLQPSGSSASLFACLSG